MSFKRFLLLINCLTIFIASFGQWSLVLENENFWLAGTYFLNADTGFAAGEDIEEYRGIILKTSDGGATWDTAYLGDYGIVVPRVFDFIGPDTGYAAGQDGWLWRTFDGGENWELYTHAWTPIDIYNVCFLNSKVGFVDYAYTTDGGYNWTGLGFGFHTEFEKIGAEAVLAAGDDGIFRTHNLGETWDTVLYIEGISFESISMTDDLTGYCTDNLSNLYKTMDGGGTWSLVNAASFFELDRIRFVSEGLGYASFNQTDVPRIIRTEDEGATWTPELICTDQIWGYQFIGSETAYAVTADGTIYKTTNAGGATPPPWPGGVLPWSDQPCDYPDSVTSFKRPNQTISLNNPEGMTSSRNASAFRVISQSRRDGIILRGCVSTVVGPSSKCNIQSISYQQ